MIRSRAALRISFGGGGSEIDPYRSNFGGIALNGTIDMFAYTTLKKNNENLIIFNATDMGICESYKISDYPNANNSPSSNVLKISTCTYKTIMYEYLGKKKPDPLEISTFCDAPVGSGLGSSSTLTVSMLQAYNDFYSLSLGENDLAKIAYGIERKKLNLYGGQQDQYASAFGGINYIKFLKNESVEVNPLNLKWDIIAELEASLILAFTGISRDSSSIIEDQITNAVKNENENINNLHEIKEITREMKIALMGGKIKKLGELLNYSWRRKKKLSRLISNNTIDQLYELAIQKGAFGGKISGAGGGGFMIFICDPTKKGRIIDALRNNGAIIYPSNFTFSGAESWECTK